MLFHVLSQVEKKGFVLFCFVFSVCETTEALWGKSDFFFCGANFFFYYLFFSFHV